MKPQQSLLDELQRYRPASPDEEAHRQWMMELLSAPGDPLHRSHFAPGHITASAYIYDGATSRLLLHHHRRLDRWLQMGGHLEPGEAAHAAALREAEEESGLKDLRFLVDGIFDLDVHFIPAGKSEPEHHHFDVRYLVAPGASTEVRFDPNESLDLQWFDLDEAERRINAAEGSRVIDKIRAL